MGLDWLGQAVDNSQASYNSLMSNDQNVLVPFKLHDDRFKPDDDISVRFASTIPVIELILITIGEVLRVLLGDFLVCHTIAYTCIEFVE